MRACVHGLGAFAFPAECLLCRELLRQPLRGPLCERCTEALPRIEPPFCESCGLPYASSVAPGLCGPCRGGERVFHKARAGLLYEDRVRRLMLALKFGGRARLATLFGGMAAERWCRAGELEGYAAVIPLPLSSRRRRARGFNQAAIAARAVAAIAGAPMRPRLLVKTKDNRPQAGLSASARKSNVSGVYRGRIPRRMAGCKLLLVDDVMTTGATANAAARALLRAGAGTVDVLTIARVPAFALRASAGRPPDGLRASAGQAPPLAVGDV